MLFLFITCYQGLIPLNNTPVNTLTLGGFLWKYPQGFQFPFLTAF
jgi:hypothetical protein